MTAHCRYDEDGQMVRDFEREQHEYRPGLRLRGARFLSDSEIELDFEGLGTPDRVFVARRAAESAGLITFDAPFSQLYRGIPCLSAGDSLIPLVSQMFVARGDELPADAAWQRAFDDCKERVAARSAATDRPIS
jgi:hypothetical protein